MRTDPELQAKFRVAQEIGCSIQTINEMPSEEFLGWLEYLSWQNEQEKKAFDKTNKTKPRR